MKNVSKGLILLVTAATLQSCNEISSLDVNQDIIRPNYTISYSENSKRLEVKGTFTVDKLLLTYVELEGASAFRVNDVRVNKDSNDYFSTSYTYKQTNVDYEDLGPTKVSYFDVVEREYTNNLRAPKKVQFKLPDVIDEESNEVQIILPEGKNDGWISVSIHSKDQYSSGMVYPWELEIGKRVMVFDKNLVGVHAGGNINVTLCYSENTDLEVAPGKGGSVTYRYCTDSQISYVDSEYRNEEPVVEEVEETTANEERNQ